MPSAEHIFRWRGHPTSPLSFQRRGRRHDTRYGSATFVLVHVVISLISIVAGLVVMFGMLGSKRQPGLTAIFLLFTILTSATGFLIPPLCSTRRFRRT